MYKFLQLIHNWNSVILLGLLIICILQAAIGMFGRKAFTKSNNRMQVFLIISAHTQLLIGFILYGVSPTTSIAMSNFGAAMKDAILRFWAVEHVTSMVLAVIAIQVGRSISKKALTDKAKFKRSLIFFVIALIIILAVLPWGPMSPDPRPFLRMS